jgi:hypothetical protein
MKPTRSALIAAALATCALAPSAAFAADPLAWENGVNGEFGVLDLATGVFTGIGNSTNGAEPAGLAESSSGVVYTAKINGSTLYTVNTVDASLTAVGTGSISYDGIGSTTNGVFGYGTDNNLYSINTTTGASTLLGATNVAFTGFFGFSAGGSTLYELMGSDLYSLNTTTGAGTLIGSTGGSGFGAAVSEGGVLYAGSESPLAIYTLNPSTGAGVECPNLTGTSEEIFGLAPDIPSAPGVPEPAAWALMLIGFGGLGAALRAQRRRVALA